jgi:hypothetical protein
MAVHDEGVEVCIESHGRHYKLLIINVLFHPNSQIKCFRTYVDMGLFSCFLCGTRVQNSFAPLSYTIYRDSWGRDNAVCKVTRLRAERLGNCGSVPRRSKRFSPCLQRPDRLSDQRLLPPVQWVLRSLSQGIKVARA